MNPLEIPAPRILDFDIENRPLSYLGMDYTTAEVTAIAWSWNPDAPVTVKLLGLDDPAAMLEAFRRAYDEADIVTGHYIRKHDLPIINGAMLELGLNQLAPKLTSDTKLDLATLSGVSKSQESLAAMLGIEHPKIHMTQADWRAANRLTLEGLRKTEERVAGDVRQHMALRNELVRRRLLRPPKTWKPT